MRLLDQSGNQKDPAYKANAHKKVLMKNDMGICLKGWLTDKIGLLCYTAIQLYFIGLIEAKKAGD